VLVAFVVDGHSLHVQVVGSFDVDLARFERDRVDTHVRQPFA